MMQEVKESYEAIQKNILYGYSQYFYKLMYSIIVIIMQNFK